MTRKIALPLVCFLALGLLPETASAQDAGEGEVVTAAEPGLGNGVLAGLGIGAAVLGAGLGIGRIGGSAVEAMARQPEMAGTIQTGMIIAAALIEGVALLGVIFCLVLAFV